MNRILILILLFLLSCNDNTNQIEGYYHDDTYSILYQFDKSTFTKFDLLDSTDVKKKYNLFDNVLLVGEKRYIYKCNNDTLILYNFRNDTINSTLVKFKLNECDKKIIESKTWKFSIDTLGVNTVTKKPEKYKQDQFIDIDFDKGIKLYYRDYTAVRTDTMYYGNYAYVGKYFNKFPVFRKSFTLYVLNDCHDNIIDFIAYGGHLNSYKFSLEDCKCKVNYPRNFVLFSFSRNTTVIGEGEKFREFAKATKTNFLNIQDDEWTWEKDERFLKEIIKRGDIVEVYGVHDPAKIDTNSRLAKEIEYLTNYGYKWTNDYSYLVKNLKPAFQGQ